MAMSTAPGVSDLLALKMDIALGIGHKDKDFD
jgi:hypothetical protein